MCCRSSRHLDHDLYTRRGWVGSSSPRGAIIQCSCSCGPPLPRFGGWDTNLSCCLLVRDAVLGPFSDGGGDAAPSAATTNPAEPPRVPSGLPGRPGRGPVRHPPAGQQQLGQVRAGGRREEVGGIGRSRWLLNPRMGRATGTCAAGLFLQGSNSWAR